MKPFASNPGVWDAYTAWINARAAGVVNARAMASGSSSHIYSAIEFNAVRNLTTGLPCDTGANKCVLSMVVPKAPVDYYSYSAWDSFLAGLTPAPTATQLQTDLSTALGWAAKRTDVSVTPARFIVGEFGAPRDRSDYGECSAMSHIATLIGAVPAWGAARAILWQIIDNPPPATTLANAPGVRGRSPTSVAACPSRSLNKRPRRIPRRNSREDLDEPGVGTTGSTMRTAPGRLSRWLVQRGSSSWAARARGSSADGRAEKQCRLRRGTLRTWLHSARSARCAR